MFLKGLYLLLGVTSLANGAWMLIDPQSWYTGIPAAVPDTGDYNPHFIRDIGLAYMISGIGFVWAARNLERCRVIHFGQTMFVTGHAVLHVADILFERLPHTHWWIDAPLIFLPGIIMVALCVPTVWEWALPPTAGDTP